MPDIAVLMVFIPTFLFISITPGMCMTLAMTLGMTIGIRRTLWMMLGEVIGVASVAVMAVVGIASLMLNYPTIFSIFKWVGGIYLAYLGMRMWMSKASIESLEGSTAIASNFQLISQGFVTAIANPKGWAFMVSILPPFINIEKTLSTQLLVLVSIIMLSEFLCMMIYASGGKGLRLALSKGDRIKWLNRIAGSLLSLVGVWLIMS
ncbi:LysE family translocator [Glaciecola sp. MH2013]|uniref:LysE family translocator n=1 Tax=Glaciecola sp. MH2013 TaxID=2785524 RepID=UPI00189E952A|nr:LysE family translocator [Glaciecola sp. MH2013]MBF7074685.1 LysE family translocator [Glaciecola sp. MH2013]